jgi:hypothetical protein
MVSELTLINTEIPRLLDNLAQLKPSCNIKLHKNVSSDCGNQHQEVASILFNTLTFPD